MVAAIILFCGALLIGAIAKMVRHVNTKEEWSARGVDIASLESRRRRGGVAARPGLILAALDCRRRPCSNAVATRSRTPRRYDRVIETTPTPAAAAAAEEAIGKEVTAPEPAPAAEPAPAPAEESGCVIA